MSDDVSTERPLATLGSVVLDCPDPLALAGFYAAVLGGTVKAEEDWVDVLVPGATTLAFQAAPGWVAPAWPSAEASQQFHLDLTVDDLDAAERRVLDLGAEPLDRGDGTRTYRVYADPAGHPFCLCAC
ncbi:VOC family protein [Streptomyces sp. PTM05]|uniref:VOC family protein n=1 Tax=Streptantibioticus parmotrematis TaxID=2873249 RepID=A0ABS7QPT2_9ACTN|nr:VOC family protein [Streptantibioticus parmotrematis]MBY8884674.1 VOC family protein [Streptantibioticus parmotrematis]